MEQALNTIAPTYTHFVFYDEISDFPCISIVPVVETRAHYGDNRRMNITRFQIRGYIQDERTFEACEELADAIEEVISNFRSWASPSVQDVRITSIETDNGLHAPAGIVIMEIEYIEDNL